MIGFHAPRAIFCFFFCCCAAAVLCAFPGCGKGKTRRQDAKPGGERLKRSPHLLETCGEACSGRRRAASPCVHDVGRPTRGKNRPKATVVFLRASPVLDRGAPARPGVCHGGSSLEQRRAKRTPTSLGRQQQRQRCRRGGSEALGHSEQGVDGRAGGCSRRRLGQATANSDDPCRPCGGGFGAREGRAVASQRAGRQRRAEEREVES